MYKKIYLNSNEHKLNIETVIRAVPKLYIFMCYVQIYNYSHRVFIVMTTRTIVPEPYTRGVWTRDVILQISLHKTQIFRS